MSDILNLSSLFVKDKRRYLLRDISFSLGEETTLVFIGESGSGKTMTLKSILGILPEDTEVEKGSVTDG